MVNEFLWSVVPCRGCESLCDNLNLFLSDVLIVILVLSLQNCPFQPKLNDGEDEDINKMILELRKRLHDQVTPTSIPNDMGLLLDGSSKSF
jgi:hypothetical protein